VFLWAVPPAELAGKIEIAHLSAVRLFGGRAAAIVSALVALALAGCVGAMLMAGPRIAVAMAEDGVFYRGLARRNARGAPSRAVALQVFVAAAFAGLAAFEKILVYVGFTLTLAAAATVAAAFVLRRGEPQARRPHRAFGWPISGALFLALATAMTALSFSERPRESAGGLLTLVVGAVAYLVWPRDRVAKD
jgi:basic amino acid/polyamine antiporter, APA family